MKEANPGLALFVPRLQHIEFLALSHPSGSGAHIYATVAADPHGDAPIVYTNGGRAILAIEKGPPGDRAFAESFAGWGY